MKHASKLKGRPPSVEFGPVRSESVLEERIYCDGNRVVVPLIGSKGRIARLPRKCIKCGTTVGLESCTSTLVTQTRRLDQLIPVVTSHFWICRGHARIARAWRWAGCAMLLGSVVVFLEPLGTVSFFSWTDAQHAVWVIAFSALFALGLYLAGPWRGPLRSWKVRDEQVWITGTGRAFRSQIGEASARGGAGASK
jgi:hypothetical protein